MAGLLNQDRRRRAKDERAERQRRLLEAAQKAVLSRPYTELELDSLDRSAGLRQGAASMYFGSLEGVVIRMFREELGDWLNKLEERLSALTEPIQVNAAAELIADTLRGRLLLRRIIAVLPVALERRTVEMDLVLDLERWRLERLSRAAAVLARSCTTLTLEAALTLLRRACLLAAAVEPLANPPSGMALATNDLDLARLYPESEAELRDLLMGAAAKPEP